MVAKAGTATMEVTTVGNQTAATDVGAEALATRLFTAALGTMDLLHVYVGQKLGLYRLMVGADALYPG